MQEQHGSALLFLRVQGDPSKAAEAENPISTPFPLPWLTQDEKPSRDPAQGGSLQSGEGHKDKDIYSPLTDTAEGLSCPAPSFLPPVR